jgi:hypothetical protein
MDQVFGAEMLRMENQRVINKFKKNIKKAKKQILKMSSMKNINLELGDSNKIINQLTIELFDDFSWNKVKNKNQVNWKEYFHNLYDLIVCDFDSDHPSNLIVAREIINYHNILKQPNEMDFNDKFYPIIGNINYLFNKLKDEQRKVADRLRNMKDCIRDTMRETTHIQYEIIEWQSAVRKLERENDVYYEILRWSTR